MSQKGEVGELGGDAGVEEGNSLKKHYVTKECMMAQCLRGRGLNERKRVLLEQIWQPDGKPLFSCLANQGLWPCLTSTLESQGFGAGSRPRCAQVWYLTRQGRLSLVDRPITLPFHQLCASMHHQGCSSTSAQFRDSLDQRWAS